MVNSDPGGAIQALRKQPNGLVSGYYKGSQEAAQWSLSGARGSRMVSSVP